MYDIVCEVHPYKRKKYKKKRKRKGLIIFLSVLLFIIFLVTLHLKVNVDPLIQKISEQRVKAKVGSIIDLTAAEVFDNNFTYRDFVTVDKDSAGNVALIQTNSVLINYAARNLSLKTQEKINAEKAIDTNVPLGAFSGVAALAGYGGQVAVKAVPLGAVTYDYFSEFESAGINQTIHRLYLNVKAEIELVLPGNNSSFINQTKIIIAENIIVGKIPQFYIDSLQTNR